MQNVLQLFWEKDEIFYNKLGKNVYWRKQLNTIPKCYKKGDFLEFFFLGFLNLGARN